jgi:PP-loop superfamily ATP-utilizing enzyme
MDDSGRIPFVYINTDWSNANKEYSVPIPFMDGDMTALEIRNIAKQKNISLQPPTILW